MRQYIKKTLSFLLASLLLQMVTINAFAVLPPKYLNVENFKQCLADKNMGTWTAWCMPATKPASCPNESWQQLNKLTSKARVPNC